MIENLSAMKEKWKFLKSKFLRLLNEIWYKISLRAGVTSCITLSMLSYRKLLESSKTCHQCIKKSGWLR
jgi:hypothetical protein